MIWTVLRTSLARHRSFPRNVAYAPCFVIPLLPPWRMLCSELAFIHCVNKSAFAYFASGLSALYGIEIPFPSDQRWLMFAYANINGIDRCRHGTKVKCDFNKAINMHSRGQTEQHFYVWEPRCGYLLKVEKVSLCHLIEEGHRFAIILETVLVPPSSILLGNYGIKDIIVCVFPK